MGYEFFRFSDLLRAVTEKYSNIDMVGCQEKSKTRKKGKSKKTNYDFLFYDLFKRFMRQSQKR